MITLIFFMPLFLASSIPALYRDITLLKIQVNFDERHLKFGRIFIFAFSSTSSTVKCSKKKECIFQIVPKIFFILQQYYFFY